MSQARRMVACSLASLTKRISSSGPQTSINSDGQLTPWRILVRTLRSQPSTWLSKPSWVANGNQTRVRFSSQPGMRRLSSPTECASSTPKLAGAFSGPKRMPSQISRSRSLGWHNKVLRPSLVITSQAWGSVNPVK